jgi:hypothetical protein
VVRAGLHDEGYGLLLHKKDSQKILKTISGHSTLLIFHLVTLSL